MYDNELKNKNNDIKISK